MTTISRHALAKINARNSRLLICLPGGEVERGVCNYCYAAEALDSYLTARAKTEGVSYSLDREFLASRLHLGVRKFFGVTINVDEMTIGDKCEPSGGFLSRWLKQFQATELAAKV